jgi:Bifunctional DNA primase/polymerase, N-terminal
MSTITDDLVDVHPIQLKPENVENVAGKWITNDILLQAAAYYAQAGRPVFPCCPWFGAFNDYKGEPIKAKAPLVRNGFKDATTDQDQLARWWAQFPFAMLGMPVRADELCIDVDPATVGTGGR